MSDHTCNDALTDLYQYLDHELDTETRAIVERHLSSCSPCLEAFDFEAELRKVIRDRSQERVPDELRAKVLAALAACEPDID